MWTILPAPNLQTLALAVAVPEVTPWAAALCIVAGVVANVTARGWARTVGVLSAALALGWALLPWCLLPSTIMRCEREMVAVLGAGYTGGAAPPFAARPYDLVTALTGDRGRGVVRSRLDLPVKTRDGQRLGLDVYGLPGRGPRPTLLIIYGGAWIFGSRADSAPIARAFAQLGFTTIALDYRHAPAYRFPTQIDDVLDAIATIAHNARNWDVDPRRVAILGRSAGAQLALLAAYEPEPLPIRAVVAYYAPTDLVAGYRIPPDPDPADVDRILRAYLGGPPEERMNAYVAASPINHVRPHLPPTLLIGGGRDELVRLGFGHELRDALRSHNNRVVALDLPWSNHAFDSISNGTGGQLARYYTERFLNATL